MVRSIKFDGTQRFISRRLGALTLAAGILLSACGETATSTPAAGRTALTPGAISSVRPGPQVGATGEITVVAPPATGENISGQIFFSKDNNIWQGGAGTAGAPPVSVKDLGGKPLTKVDPLALAKSPAVSPDGGRLAYAFSPEPEGSAGSIIIGQDIYVIDLKTGASTMLVKRDEPQTFLDNPAWSRDGKYLYFDARSPKKDKTNTIVGEYISVNRLEMATGQRESLVEDAREPAPLPDGKRMVYVSVNASAGTYQTNLKIFDLQTKTAKDVLEPGKGFGGFYLPRPSPDGQTLVFAATGGPDSPGQPPSGQAPGAGSLTGFSSGLRGVAEESLLAGGLHAPARHGTPYDLWLVKPDAGSASLKRLTSLYEDQPMPAWSSDGKRIAFLAGQGFYIIDADGKNLQKKSDKGGHAGFDWRS